MRTCSHTETLGDGRLWLPSRGLIGCVPGAMARRCDDPSRVGDDNCFNHYPASPFCTVSWWFEGQGEWCDVGGEQAATQPRRRVPRVTFNGPQRRPVATWCAPPFHGLMLAFRPDALRRLTGVDPARWVDRWGDAFEVLPADWHDLLRQVFDATDDADRMAVVEDFLAPRWRDHRPSPVPSMQRVLEWCEHAALRAALSGTGRSARQVERRFKHWLGLPQRELYAIGRTERAFFQALELEARQGRIDWPDVAASAGYADQAHLIRETRRITGFPPAALRRLTRTVPGFWMYRLWGLWG